MFTTLVVVNNIEIVNKKDYFTGLILGGIRVRDLIQLNRVYNHGNRY